MLDKDKMKEIAELMEEYKLTEIEYEIGDEKICLKREEKRSESCQAPMPFLYAAPGCLPQGFPNTAAVSGTEYVKDIAANTAAANPYSADGAEAAEGKIVKAPLVGTFYAAPGEGKPPYVKVGDSVKKGQIIGIIEAMKLMNEIESDTDGVVAEVLAENGRLVEFGQGLIRVK